jgi:hypothetical protein
MWSWPRIYLEDIWGDPVRSVTINQLISCGGGFEYLHRSTASKRRRKGNSVPGGIPGPPCAWGIYIPGPGPPDWGSLEFETVKCGHESRGIRTKEWMRWQGSAAVVNYRSTLSSERMLHKEYDCKCSIEKNSLAASLNGLGAKMNRLAVNR